MRHLRAWLLRCAGLFHREQGSRDFAEELETHLQMHVEDNLRSGMNPEEARRHALIRLGGIAQTKERYRDRNTLPALEILWSDIRFGLRVLWKNRGFAIVAIATLALGIAGNTAIFSIVNAVLLNPLPFPHPEQLVALDESKPNFNQGSISYPNFLDWQKDNRTFSAMAVARLYGFSLTGKGEAEQIKAELITRDFFLCSASARSLAAPSQPLKSSPAPLPLRSSVKGYGGANSMRRGKSWDKASRSTAVATPSSASSRQAFNWCCQASASATSMRPFASGTIRCSCIATPVLASMASAGSSLE